MGPGGRLTHCGASTDAFVSREVRIHVHRGVHGVDRRGLRPARSGPAGGGAAVIQNIVGLVLAVGIAAYLIAALLFPERF
ncbi:K(+)-transporting ATPase subunit F [Nocardia sp. CC227C]|uniref:K(+)-transporting ATPase subunit F n=1 Tax=Nocardia sp. CC227C TaxID=3044562 RepID=UPI00278BB20D|nr:K(+)-transporting ATPase subunit F [Nocardia sp. CC227C]